MVLASLSPLAEGRAQDSTRAPASPAYSTMSVGIAGGRTIDDGALADFWDSGTTLRLDVYTRFHRGDVGAWLLTLPWDARSAEQPDFRAYIFGLDWRFTRSVTRWLRPSASVSAGNFLSTFEGVETKGLKKESEIFIGASAGLAVGVTRATSLTATVTGINVFTSTPIRTTFATVGVSHGFATPDWLRGVFE